MTELINLFSKLSDYFDKSSAKWEDLEEEYQKEIELRQSSPDAEGPISSCAVVKAAQNDGQLISTLLEICTTIRDLRGENSSSYDNTYDSWDKVIKEASGSAYLSFIYTLAGLAILEFNAIFIKISLTAVNTYLLSLTIPGSKSFHVFEETVIEHCLQVFSVIEKIQNPDLVHKLSRQNNIETWVRFVSLCDDIKLLLRYVHFKDHKETLYKLMKRLLDIQYLNYEKGYFNNYSVMLHSKCYEIFEEMTNSHNGEPEETLLKLMNFTIFMHTYPSRPKCSADISISTSSQCEHISDWFIKCIAKFPRIIVKVLTFYIKSVVTNPIKWWKTEQTQRALEYAAKYDAALFTKCNESCVEFVCDSIYADEATIRLRTVELMAQILQLESSVEWQMFRHEVASIPREVHLIKELIDSLRDTNNNVKLRAAQTLHAILLKGSPNAKTILRESLQFAQFNDSDVELPVEPRVQKNEIRFGKPKTPVPQYSFEGHGLIELSILHLPEYVYINLFQSTMSHLRRVGVAFMEQVIKVNPLVIFNTNFVNETLGLVNEPVSLVRKQTLQSIDNLLGCYPNCYPVIWVWCKIISPMLQDGDVKNIDLAMECFRSRVLQNIEGIDKSNQAEHFMPWVIIRTMLSTNNRLYLQNCFHQALQKRLITSQMLNMIESHLVTSNSTEAWSMLNFISGKMKSKEPDSLIHLFISLESWNKEQNMLIALEVLSNCIQDFSHTALNLAFNHIITTMREGKIMPVLIGKAFDFLLLIDNWSNAHSSKKSNSRNAAVDSSNKEWIRELHDLLQIKILEGIADFPENRSIFMSYLYSYSEVNLQTRMRPHKTIISFIHKYIIECIKLPETELDLENERLFNSMILLAGRLSLRDAYVASPTCNLYSRILQTSDRPSIVNTIIVSITDLCKKHTDIVESIINDVLMKLSSPYEVNRIETFKCFEKLVLQDQLKLRGTLLLIMLSKILDDSEKLSARACEFFAEYLAKKSPTLFQRCIIECPFVFNDYENFDGLDSFASTTVKSPLKGDEMAHHRQMLYNHMLTQIDEVQMILHFDHLKLIAEKAQRDPLIKSPSGIALINDSLFIMKRICYVSKPSKPSKDDENNKEDEALAEVNEMIATTDANAAGATAAQTKGKKGGGRGRRGREVITMSQALESLEIALAFIPIIHEHTHQIHESIQKSFDDLCKALNKRFPDLIKEALPAEFWDKYRCPEQEQTATKKTGKKRTNDERKQQQSQSQEPTDEADTDEPTNLTDDESNFSSEGDVPLVARHPEDICSKIARTEYTELPMEYIFNPNI